ncbi:MAG TPA: hypothetical protein VD770_00550, partial [Coxiellaceae bacterium]|nr:hypothetical protein [Coxiellaceae bacterium]
PSAPPSDAELTAKELAKVAEDSAKATNNLAEQHSDNTGVAAPLLPPCAGAGVPRESSLTSPETDFRPTGPAATTEEDPADLYRGCAGAGVPRNEPYDEVPYAAARAELQAVAPHRTQTGFNPALMPAVPSAPIDIPLENPTSSNTGITRSLNRVRPGV